METCDLFICYTTIYSKKVASEQEKKYIKWRDKSHVSLNDTMKSTKYVWAYVKFFIWFFYFFWLFSFICNVIRSKIRASHYQHCINWILLKEFIYIFVFRVCCCALHYPFTFFPFYLCDMYGFTVVMNGFINITLMI